ncbi:MATE family efflux transporter [Svornostia abyssi]|uniref:MATE family efflux transporter n=1 Tax=Svornostia abyssi TaxID=2898438 RepID=A0ABY5PIE8_9ACTN|nr:MATE family efflux transporter [Parviterribacteraceae bacterium J379]
MSGRSLDRQILRLAVPALGALAAEPLYLLVDTAIVGHLGTPQLAALAIAATILTSLVSLCIFLTYGTTAQVARLHGAGDDAAAGGLAAQALWLALALSAALVTGCVVLADPLVAVLGGSGEVADLAARYLRISALGLPFALIALAGQGFLRGIGDLRTPLIVVVVAQAANIVLEVWFVYGLGWGLDGSAAGTVIAQAGMGAAFAWLLLRAPADDRRPDRARIRPLLKISGELFVRSAALLVAFATASAVLARVGEASLGAHLIAFQLFVFGALVLDAVAIAAQVLVGRALGADDADGARAAGWRVILWALVAGCIFGVVLVALRDVIPRAFTPDQAVLDQAAEVWWLFALMQPIAAVVFALDGILIGAGDTRFLAGSMVVAGPLVYMPVALASLAFDWGIVGVWCGLVGLMLARLVLLGARWLGGRWAVTGAVRATQS